MPPPPTPTPLVTIGITCYREGEWLRECWESVLAQTDDRWEAVIVMDGGHDDATRAVFDSIEHPKLRKHVFRKNVGPYPARNKAFEITQTPFHFYVDGDDQLLPNSIELALEAFHHYPDAALVYGDYEVFGDGNAPRVKKHPRQLPWDRVVRGNDAGPGAAAYAKWAWEDLGGFTLELARGSADRDFQYSLLEKGYRLQHVGSCLYRRRIVASGVNISNRRIKHRIADTLVLRHPVLFEKEDRRRIFLTRQYQRSYQAFYNDAELKEAKALARKALKKDCCGKMRGSMLALAILPITVFRFLRRVRRKIRSMKSRGGNAEDASLRNQC